MRRTGNQPSASSLSSSFGVIYACPLHGTQVRRRTLHVWSVSMFRPFSQPLYMLDTWIRCLLMTNLNLARERFVSTTAAAKFCLWFMNLNPVFFCCCCFLLWYPGKRLWLFFLCHCPPRCLLLLLVLKCCGVKCCCCSLLFFVLFCCWKSIFMAIY